MPGWPTDAVGVDLVGLLDGSRCVSYDRRGFGDTSGPAEAFSHVDDLVAVLDDRDIESAVLVGNSQGGRVAIDMALAHPERVQERPCLDRR